MGARCQTFCGALRRRTVRQRSALSAQRVGTSSASASGSNWRHMLVNDYHRDISPPSRIYTALGPVGWQARTFQTNYTKPQEYHALPHLIAALYSGLELRNPASAAAIPMASYTRPPGPNGAMPPNYPQQLPAPPLSHNGNYPQSQALPSMAPSTNGGGPYGAAPSYSQPQPPYQHHQPPYQSQSPHQQQHHSQQRPPQSHQQQTYQPQQQPPPQAQLQRSQASPASTSPTQPQSQATAGEGVGKLEPISIVVNGRRYA